MAQHPQPVGSVLKRHALVLAYLACVAVIALIIILAPEHHRHTPPIPTVRQTPISNPSPEATVTYFPAQPPLWSGGTPEPILTPSATSNPTPVTVTVTDTPAPTPAVPAPPVAATPPPTAIATPTIQLPHAGSGGLIH